MRRSPMKGFEGYCHVCEDDNWFVDGHCVVVLPDLYTDQVWIPALGASP